MRWKERWCCNIGECGETNSCSDTFLAGEEEVEVRDGWVGGCGRGKYYGYWGGGLMWV